MKGHLRYAESQTRALLVQKGHRVGWEVPTWSRGGGLLLQLLLQLLHLGLVLCRMPHATVTTTQKAVDNAAERGEEQIRQSQ
jgi:hypothetical protein